VKHLSSTPEVELYNPEPLLRPHMPELDTLRGAAVLMVLFFHAFGFEYGLDGLSGISKVFVATTLPGWVGVNLFFVLSGFLITGILLDTKTRSDYYKRFYLRRALRILPLYYGILVLLLILSRTRLIDRPASWPFLLLSSVYLANVTALFGVPMQFGVLWSLAVEEHFYLLWPTLVRFLSRRRVALSGVVVCAICLGLRVLYYEKGYNTGNGYTWLVADGLAMGATLAAVMRGPWGTRSNLKRIALLCIGISLGTFIFGSPFGIFRASRFLGVTVRETPLNLFFVGVLATMLLLGTSRWKSLVCRPVLQFFGEISYGVYLLHMLVFEFLDHLWGAQHAAAREKGHIGFMLLRFAVGGALTVAIAYLSRWYFEQPFLRLKQRERQRSGHEAIPVPLKVRQSESAS
jgi:peptidoglycan/LPS O-acetylase OafA/YrhL